MRHAMMKAAVMTAALLAIAAPAGAEVKSANDSGFVIAATVTVAASPAQVYAALIAPSRWWDAAHSYSGSAANFSIAPVAGGCFCEKLPKSGGSIEHGRVVMAMPGEALRISGALGPLQSMGVAGVLSWDLKPAGKGTEIVHSYTVGGHFPGGATGIAPMVDKVMAAQLARLKAYVETGRPD